MAGHGWACRRALLVCAGALAAGWCAIGDDGSLRAKQFRVTPQEGAGAGDAGHAPDCNILTPPEGVRGLSVPELWPGGVVPYVYSGNTTAQMQSAARAAMDELEAVSAVRFVPRTTEYDYIFIQNSTVNSSFVGRQGGAQAVNIASWSWKFIIAHELMHALGIWHEHQRSDRDPYVVINWANIQPGAEHNFFVQAGVNHGMYDFESVMHYSRCAFGACACSAACQTISVQPGFEAFQLLMGQRTRLSDGDIATINELYDGGAVENVTTSQFYGTLTDAISAATSGDLLRSEPSQFSRRPDYDLAGKALIVQSIGAVETAGGSNFILADLASLDAEVGADLTIRGDLTLPAAAQASASGEFAEVASGGRLVVSDDAVATLLAGAGVTIAGRIDAAAGSTVFIDSPSFVTEVGSVVSAGAGALVASVSTGPTQLDGELELAADSGLSTGGPLATGDASEVRFLATAGALYAPQATLDGAVEVADDAVGVVQATSVDGGGSIIIGSNATLTLHTDDFAWADDGTISAAPSGRLLIPNARATVSIDGRHMTLLDGARVETAASLLVGALRQPPVFTDRTVTGEQVSPQAVAVGDINADGWTDVVVASFDDSRLAWHRNDGVTVNRFGVMSLIDAVAGGPLGVAIGDINGDGDLDVAAGASVAGAVRWYEHSGGPSPTWTRHTVATGLDGASAVAIVDLDGDQDADLLSTARNAGSVSWHENLGVGPSTFATHTIDGAFAGASDVKAADLDGDGDLDVIAAAQTGGEVAWYERLPGSPVTFQKHILLASGGGASALRVADLNGDAAPDIVVAERAAGRVTLLRSDGGSPPVFIDQVVAVVSTPSSIDVADVNGDGRPDVIVGSLQGGGVTWHANNGAPAPFFEAAVVRSPLSGVTGVAGADIDGDDDLDVIAGAQHLDAVFWEEQRPRFTHLQIGAALASPSFIEHHRLLELEGGSVETPSLLIADSARLKGFGAVTGDLILEGRLGGAVDLAIGGALRAAPDAALDIAGGEISLGGDFEIAIVDPSRIDLQDASIVLGGGGSHRLEATSLDVGADALPVLAALRIEAGTTVDLADDYSNAGGGLEAVYTDQLTIEPGAKLRTNGVRIYYGDLLDEGIVDGAEHLVALLRCDADLTGDGVVDGADLGLLIGFWSTSGGAADLNGDGVVDGGDLGILLGAWGACD